jgi:asparagine synthase (glutamine-hydrolysing)
MCGISAIINSTNSKPVSSKQIIQMNERLNHRGPDGSGIWQSESNHVYLGHKRLSIIDISENAQQPMLSIDHRYIIIFNGEIYNYRELREECIKLGSQFFSSSDTEVILESYRHWGEKCLSYFRGMWAFILFDIYKNKILISRDPFGIKPLYYGFFKGHFYFASEPKALTCLSDHFLEEDLVTTRLFLEYGYLDREDWTFYKHIKRFPHAHYSIINLNGTQTELNFHRYWQPNSQINYSLSFDKAAKKLKELFYDSVQLHLRSDVPVGACLSGGIDSSAIVCFGKEIMGSSPISTFTTHYPSYPKINESSWAQKIIDHTHSKAYFIEPTQQLFLQSLDNLITSQDEPFGSMSIFAQYCVFKKISETNIKVVLDGQGSDEMLAGYLGFIPIYFDELMKKGKFISLIKELLAFKDMNIQYDAAAKMKQIFKNRFKSGKNIKTPGIQNKQDQGDLEFRLSLLNQHFCNFEERLEDLLCVSNIPQLLRYEDRNSMCFSIESRVPFLNTELVDFILSLPANYKIRNGFSKAILREALKGIVPDAILKRRDKLGFPAPEVEWMRNCYGINSEGAGSIQWREFIHTRWQTQNNILQSQFIGAET